MGISVLVPPSRPGWVEVARWSRRPQNAAVELAARVVLTGGSAWAAGGVGDRGASACSRSTRAGTGAGEYYSRGFAVSAVLGTLGSDLTRMYCRTG